MALGGSLGLDTTMASRASSGYSNQFGPPATWPQAANQTTDVQMALGSNAVTEGLFLTAVVFFGFI